MKNTKYIKQALTMANFKVSKAEDGLWLYERELKLAIKERDKILKDLQKTGNWFTRLWT